MFEFTLPTLITLTAPSCAGKSFLLEILAANGCQRIVSTTDRPQRVGEIQGVHYDFITTEKSKEMEMRWQFAELVTFNGTRYGVTHEEMEGKMSTKAPPIVILEPKGIEIYRKYCAAKGWKLFTIYVETVEAVRLQRLIDRTTDQLHAADMHSWNTIRDIVSANNKRLKAILDEERSWGSTNRWDCIVDGTNSDKALDTIQRGIAYRNSRPEIYA